MAADTTAPANLSVGYRLKQFNGTIFFVML
jgi:hypothetical protein